MTIVAGDAGGKRKAEALAKKMVRGNWSNPPTHGAAIVEMVLTDPALRAEWEAELAEMRDRIKQMRVRMADSLQQRHPNRGFNAVKQQAGMFSYSGLRPSEAERLRRDHHIYVLDTGRICVAGLNEHNITRFLDAVSASLDPA
jgi:aromatic-amino-acid transaminase